MARKSPSAVETGSHEALAAAIPIWIAWLSGSRSGVPSRRASVEKKGANWGHQAAGCPTHSRRLRMSGSSEFRKDGRRLEMNETNLSHPTKRRLGGAPGDRTEEKEV